MVSRVFVVVGNIFLARRQRTAHFKEPLLPKAGASI
jgi:hypothetical protein